MIASHYSIDLLTVLVVLGVILAIVLILHYLRR